MEGRDRTFLWDSEGLISRLANERLNARFWLPNGILCLLSSHLASIIAGGKLWAHDEKCTNGEGSRHPFEKSAASLSRSAATGRLESKLLSVCIPPRLLVKSSPFSMYILVQ